MGTRHFLMETPRRLPEDAVRGVLAAPQGAPDAPRLLRGWRESAGQSQLDPPSFSPTQFQHLCAQKPQEGLGMLRRCFAAVRGHHRRCPKAEFRPHTLLGTSLAKPERSRARLVLSRLWKVAGRSAGNPGDLQFPETLRFRGQG